MEHLFLGDEHHAFFLPMGAAYLWAFQRLGVPPNTRVTMKIFRGGVGPDRVFSVDRVDKCHDPQETYYGWVLESGAVWKHEPGMCVYVCARMCVFMCVHLCWQARANKTTKRQRNKADNTQDMATT